MTDRVHRSRLVSSSEPFRTTDPAHGWHLIADDLDERWLKIEDEIDAYLAKRAAFDDYLAERERA